MSVFADVPHASAVPPTFQEAVAAVARKPIVVTTPQPKNKTPGPDVKDATGVRHLGLDAEFVFDPQVHAVVPGLPLPAAQAAGRVTAVEQLGKMRAIVDTLYAYKKLRHYAADGHEVVQCAPSEMQRYPTRTIAPFVPGRFNNTYEPHACDFDAAEALVMAMELFEPPRADKLHQLVPYLRP